MTADERSVFVSAYTEILLAAWSSGRFADQLAADPRLAVAQFGLDVPDGARIEVCQHIRADHGEPSLDFAVDEWAAGEQTGLFRLYVPRPRKCSWPNWTPTTWPCSRVGWPPVNVVAHLAVAVNEVLASGYPSEGRRKEMR